MQEYIYIHTYTYTYIYVYIYVCPYIYILYVDVLNPHTKYVDPQLIYVDMVKMCVMKGQN